MIVKCVYVEIKMILRYYKRHIPIGAPSLEAFSIDLIS